MVYQINMVVMPDFVEPPSAARSLLLLLTLRCFQSVCCCFRLLACWFSYALLWLHDCGWNPFAHPENYMKAHTSPSNKVLGEARTSPDER